MKRNLKTALLLILLPVWLASCRKPEAPEFQSVRNVQINDGDSGTVVLTGEADFFNPNNYRIVLKNADIDIIFNGKKITDFKHDYDFAIEKKASFTIPMEFTFSRKVINDNLIGSALNILLGKKLTFRYVGQIRIKAWGVGMKVPVDGETNLDFKNL